MKLLRILLIILIIAVVVAILSLLGVLDIFSSEAEPVTRTVSGGINDATDAIRSVAN